MSQKIIPISLRLNKKKNWHSKWIIEKNEYFNSFFFDIEIRKYLEEIINNEKFEIVKLIIKKFSKNINIYIYLNHKKNTKETFILSNKEIYYLNKYYPNNYFKIFIKRFFPQKLNKIISKIFKIIKKRYKINFYNKIIIYNFTYALITKNPKMINILIKKLLEKKKIHKKIIKNITNIFEIFFNFFNNLIGYRLQFKGRINGYKRKKKIIFQKGKIPLNTLKYNIKYDFNEFKTPSGVCSIKFWLFFKKK